MARGSGRAWWFVGLLGCGGGGGGGGSASADGSDSIDPSAGTDPSTSSASVDDGGTTSATATPSTSSGEPADTTDGPKFDVGVDTEGTTGGGPVDVCHVADDMDAVGECRIKAPPDSFEPEVQWSWDGFPGEPDCIVTPLVANLTDDNADGEINLCDTPDILIVGSPDWYVHGHMALLDGETGTPHFQFAEMSQWAVTPAIGDIDDDGIGEIVGSNLVGSISYLAAWEHDGTLKWTSSHDIQGEYAVALADLDTDGDVEIVVGGTVLDHDGNVQFTVPDAPTLWSATTAADLDDDGDLEIVLGRRPITTTDRSITSTDRHPRACRRSPISTRTASPKCSSCRVRAWASACSSTTAPRSTSASRPRRTTTGAAPRRSTISTATTCPRSR